MSGSENILEIKGLYKSFGSTRANRNVNFTLKKGEIKGLIGENGSGKSTLLSQIAGVYRCDSGEMFLNGAPYAPASPLDANNVKIAMVMQELGVVDKLPVAINVFLGRLGQFSSRGVVNIKKLNRAVAELFERWDLPGVPPNELMRGMMIEQRKIVELTRAMSVEPEVLLLDEITQSLSLNNRTKLYALINKLKDMGKSIIVITHDIEEMLEISDSITVLRDGEVVGDVKTSETSADEIRYMMVGREISGDYYRADMTPDYSDEVVLSAENVTIDGEIENVSFDVHRGEILGFCGLSDSGIHSVGKAVFGLSKKNSGSVRFAGSGEEIVNANDALRRKMAYVPKDRDNDALMIHASILDNCTLPSLNELQGAVGYLSPAQLKKLSSGVAERLNVKCTGIQQNMDALSGGNKQKVNLGRWIAKDLDVLILDCPTRGVDVGVKAYIYSLMKQAKKDGIAIILISDELTEILGMADRLFVMKDGRVTKTIRRDEDFTERSVIEVMM
jgi:ribose transport system ATP-binding protein